MSSVQKYIDKIQGPILILGVTSFIGANLYIKLNDKRSDIYGVTKNKNHWRLKSYNKKNLYNADFNNIARIKYIINKIKPKTIFNFIAYGSYSFENDKNKIYTTNFINTIKIIEYCKSLNLKAFINAGSSSEYGLNSNKPKEKEFAIPNSDYAVSKICISNYLTYIGKVNSFPCIHLRLYSVYGPLEDTSRLIPNLIKYALKKSYPPLVNERISRDFIYVDDVCNAFIHSASKMKPKLYGDVINIGTGKKTTIKQLTIKTKKLFKIDKDPLFGMYENRKWDLKNWVSNPNKAKEEINWVSSIDLNNGLLLTKEWIERIDSKFNSLTKKIK